MKDSNKTSPLRLQLIVAIATNPLAHEAIDRAYNQKPDYYYESYFKSDFFEYPVFRLYPTYKYMYIKKMAGIYADAATRDDYELVIKLMRRGYNAVYQYIKKSESVEMKKAVNIALRGESIESVDEETLGNIYIIIFYILEITNKNALNSQSFIYWTRRFMEYLNIMTTAERQHKEVAKYFKEVREYYSDFRIKESDYNVGNILDNLIDKDINERLEKEGLSISTITQEHYVQFRSDTFKSGGISSVVGLLSSMYKYMGFSELLLNQKFIKLEFDRFLSKYIQLVQVNQIPENLQEPLLISTIMAFALSKEYSYTRDEALDASEEASYVIQRAEKDRNKEELMRLKEQSAQQTEEIKQLKKELEGTKKNNEVISRELRRTKEELDESKASEKELVALRNHIYKLQQERPKFSREDSSTMDIEDSIEKLSLVDIVIVGGHSNWVANMKEVFPKFIYISGESVNADLSILDRRGVTVFFNTDNNTHSQYERVTNIMNKNDNKFHYISGVTNIDRAIALMVEVLEI